MESFDAVITSTILFCDNMASVVFDPSFIFSCVFVEFAMGWGLDCKYLDTLVYISTLIWVSVCVDQDYHMCFVHRV